jgi:hypothetical protein
MPSAIHTAIIGVLKQLVKALQTDLQKGEASDVSPYNVRHSITV